MYKKVPAEDGRFVVGYPSMPSRGRGYQPTEEPEPARLTIAEVGQVKRLFEESSLAWWIRAAGAGAIVEILRVGWLAARYCFKF